MLNDLISDFIPQNKCYFRIKGLTVIWKLLLYHVSVHSHAKF